MRAYARQHDRGRDDRVRSFLHRLPPVLIGIAALVWVLVRTGRKPSRVVYPCQRAALVTSWAFLGAPALAAIAAGRWKRPVAWTAVALATGWAVFALGGAGLFDPDEGLPEDHWRPAKMPA